MKVLFSSNKNPNFKTFSDYIEKAFRENECETRFFENRDFLIPGRIRDSLNLLDRWDLRRINRRLVESVRLFKPDIFVEAGGWNILPSTVKELKNMGITTALWTVDPPRIFKAIEEAAPFYDFVFTQGSEACEILKSFDVKNLYWLPFACDPDFHRPVELTPEDVERYGCDISFVGSGWEDIYPFRRSLLEGLADFNLGIWGPGWDGLPDSSPIKRYVRGGHVIPEEWAKIYSASKIVFQSHYKDPEGKIPCYQASPRVYEALACGGFLVVDGQKDILRLFKSGKDLVVFKDAKELREIVEYYLKHPEERKKIAETGRKSVINIHTYKDRVRYLLDTVSRA